MSITMYSPITQMCKRLEPEKPDTRTPLEYICQKCRKEWKHYQCFDCRILLCANCYKTHKENCQESRQLEMF